MPQHSAATPSQDPNAVLKFWFGDDIGSAAGVAARNRQWFRRDNYFDEEIRQRFGALPAQGASGGLAHWRDSPRSCLALVLALDQFPRNLYRNFRQAFDYDALALEVALSAIDRGFDARLAPIEAVFLYLPLEHAEDISAQTRCVALFEALLGGADESMRAQFESFLNFAVRHHEIIERFGRFPHRNAVLGRPSSDAEIAYLKAGGETFGAKATK